ncbi:hypothetical protein CRG98_049749, partial [Punica granatum]
MRNDVSMRRSRTWARSQLLRLRYLGYSVPLQSKLITLMVGTTKAAATRAKSREEKATGKEAAQVLLEVRLTVEMGGKSLIRERVEKKGKTGRRVMSIWVRPTCVLTRALARSIMGLISVGPVRSTPLPTGLFLLVLLSSLARYNILGLPSSSAQCNIFGPIYQLSVRSATELVTPLHS